MNDLIIFPGKNTPIKRYRSYFPKFNLKKINIYDKPEHITVILAHSIGILDALNYCIKYELNPTIVCMDGVDITIKIPNNIRIIMFRPINKYITSDSNHKVIYYDTDEYRHHPYMIKNIRNDIITVINNFN